MRSPTRVVAPVAVAALSLAIAACGSSGGSGSTASGKYNNGLGQKLGQGKKGGVLTVQQHEDFEHLDPGAAYFSLDYSIMYATQKPPYSYLPNQQAKTSPDLASAQPEIAPDGKTVTVKIKPNVHYSPPVNRAVTTADIKYAIERDFNPHVGNAYAVSYYNDIVGAQHAKGGPISGITTPNKTTIVFKLDKPVGSLLAQALSLPGAMPVPKEYAAKFDAKAPTQYGAKYEVFTGPYMLANDPKTGEFLGKGYQPGKSATLVRNPNWNPKTDFRPAYLNQINIKIGGDPPVIGRQVLEGKGLVQEDTPAQNIVKLAATKYPKQIFFVPGAGDHYIGLNNHAGVFTNVNLRRAVWAAMPRTAIVRVRGGTLVGDPMSHFIYPGVDGFDQAGGLPGPNVDFNKNPNGDMNVAKKYMKLAGYPSGKYTGSKQVLVVGSTGSPAPETAQIVNHTLQSLGFKTKFNLVDQSVMYAKYCGVPKAEVDVCPNVGWIRDFADPQTVLFPTFSGKAIVPTNNSNWSQTNDPAINAQMDKAKLVVGTQARANAWAKIDRELVKQAVAVPYIFDKEPTIESANVNGVDQVWNIGQWDYAFTSLK